MIPGDPKEFISFFPSLPSEDPLPPPEKPDENESVQYEEQDINLEEDNRSMTLSEYFNVGRKQVSKSEEDIIARTEEADLDKKILFSINEDKLHSQPPMTNVFETCGIPPDAGALNKKVDSEMCLGLETAPEKEEPPPPTPESEITPSGSITEKGNRSDDSSIFLSSEKEQEKEKLDYRIFCCVSILNVRINCIQGRFNFPGRGND